MTALEVKNSRAAEGKIDALGDFFKAVLGDTRAQNPLNEWVVQAGGIVSPLI